MAIFGTLPDPNIAPENWWSGHYFPFGKASFQVLNVSLPECIYVRFQGCNGLYIFIYLEIQTTRFKWMFG